MLPFFLRALFLLCILGEGFLFHAQAQQRRDSVLIFGTPKDTVGNNVSLTGTVYNKETGLPLPGSIVSLTPYGDGIPTDDEGRYRMQLPPGRYEISFRYLGFEIATWRVRLYANGIHDVSLAGKVVVLDEVILEGVARDRNINDITAGIEKMSIRQIRTMPALLGEVDVIRSIQMLAGVNTAGEGSAGFNVRGGRIDQNLVLQDGAMMFNTSHVLGFFSVFNPDVTEAFDLYKGHIPAQYGGRTSSVLDVRMKQGNFEKIRAQGGLGIVGSRMAINGPLIKEKTSFLLGGRWSYSGWILGLLRNPTVRNSKASFYDLNAAVSQRIGTNNTVTLSLYSSYDNFRFSDQFGYNWGTRLLNLKWNSIITPNFLSSFSLIGGDYSSTLYEPSGVEGFELENGMRYYQAKQNFLFTGLNRHKINAGLEGFVYQGQPETIRPLDAFSVVKERSISKDRGREIAIYVNDEINLDEKLTLSLGLRYSFYQHYGPKSERQYAEGQPRQLRNVTGLLEYGKGETIAQYHGPEPRAALKLQLSKNNSIKLSYNRMRQYVHLVSNSAAPTPIDIWQVSNAYLPPQMADNFSLGYYHNFQDNNWETALELYYKKSQNLVEYRDFAALLINDHLETELLGGEGSAYGGELTIRRTRGRWSGWLTYTYSRSLVRVAGVTADESVNNGDWFPAYYDQPHSLNFVARKKLAQKGAFAANFTYRSGRPFTALVASYESGTTSIPHFSDRNAYRIPDYMRLDLSFTGGTVFTKLDDDITLSFYNVLSRKNAYSIFYSRTEFFFIPKAFKLSVLGATFPALTYNVRF